MPKIDNWTRIESRRNFRKCWRNEETGEKVGVTRKVPNDGYYLMAYTPEEEMESSEGERFGFNTVKSQIYKKASSKLRENPDGLLGISSPEFEGQDIYQDGDRLAATTPDGETPHLIPEEHDNHKGWSVCGLDGEIEDLEFEYADPEDEEVCHNCQIRM